MLSWLYHCSGTGVLFFASLPSPFSSFLWREVGFGEGEAEGEIIGTTFGGGWNFKACDSNFRVARGDADTSGEVDADATGLWDG